MTNQPNETKQNGRESGLPDTACSAEDVVLDAGMEIEDGLAWLQAGHILIDGTDAPEWMHDINGFDIEEAAEIILQNQEYWRSRLASRIN